MAEAIAIMMLHIEPVSSRLYSASDISTLTLPKVNAEALTSAFNDRIMRKRLTFRFKKMLYNVIGNGCCYHDDALRTRGCEHSLYCIRNFF